MVALVSTLIVTGFALATLYAGVITVLQYGHLVGPAWRMEGAEPRGTIVSMRGQRQPALVRRGPNRPAPAARAMGQSAMRIAA